MCVCLLLLGSCQWLPADSVTCTNFGDAACPENAYCNPVAESAGEFAGQHLCTGDTPNVYPADDDDSTSVDDDDTSVDDDDTPSTDDDDDTSDDDDDSASTDDDDDDDSEGEGDYSWALWEALPNLSGVAMYGVSFPEEQEGCASQAPAGADCRVWAVGTGGTVLHSIDGGESWYHQSIPDSSGTAGTTTTDLHDAYFVNTNYGWIVGDSGVTAWTGDGGNNWNLVTVGHDDISGVYAASVGASFNVFIVTEGGKVYSSSEGGISASGWSLSSEETEPALRGISGFSATSPPHVCAVGDSGVFIQIEGSSSPSFGPLSDLADVGFRDVALLSNNEFWIVGDAGTLLSTVNASNENLWQRENDKLSHADTLTPSDLHAIDFVGQNYGWIVGTGSSIFRTTNGGDSWTGEHSETSFNSLGEAANWQNLNAVDFTTASRGVAVGNFGTILYTIPGGTTSGDDDTGGDDDDDPPPNCPNGCDQDGDSFCSTGTSGTTPCGGLDCLDAGNYASFINPLAWDGPGEDDMGGTQEDANCDNNVDYTGAAPASLGIIPPTTCTNQEFGYVVGRGNGDFNNDGIADLVFGNPSPTCGSGFPGRVTVISGVEARYLSLYGTGSGIAVNNIVASSRWTFNGPAAGFETGRSVALGEFMPSALSPGGADLLIGAPGAFSERGAVYLVLGGNSPGANCSLPGCADFTIYGSAPDDRFGETVAWAGDITGDGYQEILIGAPGYQGHSGRFYLLDGQLIQEAMTNNTSCPVGGSTPADCLNLEGLESSSGHASITGESASKLGAVPPAIGDLDGDGVPDLVLASPSAANNYGKVYVFYGDQITASDGDLQMNASGNSGVATEAQSSGLGWVAGQGFGAAIALVPNIGTDSNTLPDVAIGAPEKNDSDGAVYIVTNSAITAGLSTLGLSTVRQLAGEPQSGERFGATLAGGIIDHDLFGDLVVCAPEGGPSISASYPTGAGVARLYRGSSLKNLTLGNALSGVLYDPEVAFLGEQASSGARSEDRFCSSLNISFDVDGAPNNRNDIIIAAPGWDSPSASGGRGKAHIFANPYIAAGGQP